MGVPVCVLSYSAACSPCPPSPLLPPLTLSYSLHWLQIVSKALMEAWAVTPPALTAQCGPNFLSSLVPALVVEAAWSPIWRSSILSQSSLQLRMWLISNACQGPGHGKQGWVYLDLWLLVVTWMCSMFVWVWVLHMCFSIHGVSLSLSDNLAST